MPSRCIQLKERLQVIHLFILPLGCLELEGGACHRGLDTREKSVELERIFEFVSCLVGHFSQHFEHVPLRGVKKMFIEGERHAVRQGWYPPQQKHQRADARLHLARIEPQLKRRSLSELVGKV